MLYLDITWRLFSSWEVICWEVICKVIISHELGCPETIGMDKGTENGKLAECQIALRMLHSDHRAQRSVQYVSSPKNSVLDV